MALTSVYWITKKLKRQFHEKSSEKLKQNSDASTEMEEDQLGDIGKEKMEEKQGASKSNETGVESMQMKQTQNFLKKSKTKKFKQSLVCFWKRGIKTETKQKSVEPLAPTEMPISKPAILTPRFLEYHKKKHASMRKKIKFSPKLESVPEVKEEDEETKSGTLATVEELGPNPSTNDESDVEKKRQTFLKYGYWPDDDLYYMIKHEINPLEEPTVYKHEYTYQYEKWLEARKKLNDSSMFKTRFKKMKKFFKM